MTTTNLIIEKLRRVKQEMEEMKEVLIFNSESELEEAEKSYPNIRKDYHCHIDKNVTPGKVFILKSMHEIRKGFIK